MNRVEKAACFLLFITAPLLTAAGQDGPHKKPPADQPTTQTAEKSPAVNPTQQKIFAALDQVLEAQKSFADENLRIIIQAQAADILWSYDERRARRLFEDALQMTPSAGLAERSTYTQPSPADGSPPYSARVGVIQLIMRRDSDWATKLIESAGELANVDAKFRNSREYRERVSLQLQLGVYFTQQDPQRAPGVARAFVESGDVNSLMMLLGIIRSKDASAADELFIQALAKAKLGQPSFEDINRLAGYLFPSFGEGVIRFSSNAAKRDPFTPSVVSSAVLEQFLDLAYDAVTRRLDPAIASTNSPRLSARLPLDYSIPKLLVPYFDRFMPYRAPAYRACVEEALGRVPLEDRQYLIMTEPRSVQELLARADAIGEAKLKDTLFLRAIRQASYSGDFEQAAAIIERLSNEGGRANARDMLRRTMDLRRSEEAWSALNNNDLDKAETLVAGISDVRSDALLVFSLIGRFALKDKPRATRLLDEYKRRAAGIENSIERALWLMDLTAVASNIDLNRGFEEMRLAIVEFNGAGFAPELQKYRNAGGAATTANVNIGLSPLLNDWHLQWLGRTDFDRALALTQQFQMREAAALMQLAVCRGALENVRPAITRVATAPDATQRKALAVLEQLLRQSKSYEDAEVRARIQAQIADLLWERDEQRARGLFEDAFKATALAKLPAREKSMPPSYVGSDSHYPLRIDLVRLVAQRDPSLGARLVDSVVDQPPNVDPSFLGSAYGNYSESDMLQFQFALYITRSDPERAARIADAFLRKADFHRAITILQSLRGKDAALADDLFAQAISQAKQTGAATRANIAYLADYVFSNFGRGVIQLTTGARRQESSESTKVSPGLTTRFMELAYEAIMQWTSATARNADGASSGANGRDRFDFAVANMLLPFFDQYLPDKSSAIRTRVNEASDNAAGGGELQRAPTYPGTVEELLSRADKTTNPNDRDRIYYEAVSQAIRGRNLDQARAILERVRDERMRSQLDLMLRHATEQEQYEKARSALDSGDFDAAYELIKELSEPRLHINMLANMALALFYKKEDARALKVLDEAERLLADRENGTDRASDLLQLAGVAARLDPNRGFEDMKLAIEAVNRADLAPQWQKLDTVTDVTNGTTTRRNTGLGMLGGLFFDNGFSPLARADFDRALMLAKGVEMKEASALAQLAVCRGVLASADRSR